MKPFSLLFIFIGLIHFYAEGQRIYTGKVIDSKSKPIPNASIRILNTTIYTSTDTTGFFKLNIPVEGNYQLSITHINFATSLSSIKIDKNKSLFNYEKKILIKELILDLKLGYYDFEKEKTQKVKFSLEIDYEDRKPTNDKDIKSIVNYGQVVKLITKLAKNKHYNFLETLAEDVFDVLFKDKRIGKIMLQIEKLEIIKECASVGIQITKKRSHEEL